MRNAIPDSIPRKLLKPNFGLRCTACTRIKLCRRCKAETGIEMIELRVLESYAKKLPSHRIVLRDL